MTMSLNVAAAMLLQSRGASRESGQRVKSQLVPLSQLTAAAAAVVAAAGGGGIGATAESL